MEVLRHRWRRHTYVALALILIVTITGLSVRSGAQPTNPADDMHALVYADAEILGEMDVEVMVEYDTFTLVRTPQEVLDEIEGRGFSVDPLPDRTKIHLAAGTLDTSEGEIFLPPEKRASPRSGKQNYYLLQFVGPVKSGWVDDLTHKGIEFLEYLPNYTYVVRAIHEVAERAEDLDIVQWVGVHHPGYRIAPALQSAVLGHNDDGAGDGEFIVEFYGGELSERTRSLLEAAGLVTDEVTRLSGYPEEEPRYRILVNGRAAQLFAIISDTGFSYLAPAVQLQLFNNQARPIIGADTAHHHTLTGAGQIVGVTDSGLDGQHEMFRDDSAPGNGSGDLPPWWPLDSSARTTDTLLQRSIPFPWPIDNRTPGYGPEHRKVEAYVDLSGDMFGGSGDSIGHGTHVAGTIAGDAEPYGEWGKYDGQAFGARLAIIKAFNSLGMWGAGFDFYGVFAEAYEAGALVNNQSWGGKTTDLDDGYGTIGRDADRFTADYPSHLLVVAAGNFGDDRGLTIATPGDAKNILTVGAVNTHNPEEVMSFSSRGPTTDGRLKPDLVAPGSPIASAAADTGDRYAEQQGTSMSTPTAAGAAALVRQYYADGFYPLGEPDPAEAFAPSAALVRATLLNGAREISGPNSDRDNEGVYPNNSQGWGLLDLDGSLYWPGDDRTMQAWDEVTALTTGEVWEEPIWVADGSQPLNVHLAWTDPAPAQGADRHMVNDLNLELVSPDGTIYRGNNLTGLNPGYSTAGGESDSTNNNEGIRLLPGYSTPGDLPEGEYLIRVVGKNVPSGPQDFALVARGGMVDEWAEPDPPDDDDEQVVVTMTMTTEAWKELQDELLAYNARADINVAVNAPAHKNER